MGNESGAWVDEEFEALDLGDPRRDRRAKELLKRFAAKPTASIPGACDGWAETNRPSAKMSKDALRMIALPIFFIVG